MFDVVVAENTNEQDIFGPRDEPLVFEPGTVGWDDTDEHFDVGTADNDGNTLVRVTLFRGRDPGVRPRRGVRRQDIAHTFVPGHRLQVSSANALEGAPDNEPEN